MAHPTTRAKVRFLREVVRLHPGASAVAQRARLRQALARHSVTTHEATRFLGVYCVTKRVSELRRGGLSIRTVWCDVTTESGTTHRVGCYLLDSAKH